MINASALQRVYWKVTGLILAIVVICLLVSSYYSQKQFEQALIPEAAKKAQTVGEGVNRLILKAVDLDLDYKALYAVDLAFAELLEEHPEFAYIASTDTAGDVLYHSGEIPEDSNEFFTRNAQSFTESTLTAKGQLNKVGTQYVVSIPIISRIQTDVGIDGNDKQPLGALYIGLGSSFIQQLLTEVMLDILVILIVALFFTRELLSFITGGRVESVVDAYSHVLTTVKNGDLRARIQAGAEDELGRSMAKIDQMLDRVQDNYQRLKTKVEQFQGDEVWEELNRRYHFQQLSLSSTEQFSAKRNVKAGMMNKIRAPLFIFILAEEMTRPFLPGYVSQLLEPIPGISAQVAIGLPIVLFMLIVAFSQPYLGVWSERYGRRSAMLLGGCFTSVGFLATALAMDFYQLLLGRSACAIGYAIVFVAAQGYILDHSTPRNRAKGFALFVGAIMVATICGPSIGGILADNIGYRQSFMVTAILAAFSIYVIWQLPKDERNESSKPAQKGGLKLSVMTRLLVNGRFMSLSGLAAIPAKIGLTGIGFYLLPLYMLSLDGSQSMAGRLLMVYAVLMVVIVPMAAGMGSTMIRRERLVALGLFLSGCGALALMFSADIWAVLLLICSLGIGQAISIASQSALVADHCQHEIELYGSDAVYGVYRLFERLGNAIGPLLASVLVIYQGYQGALIGIGALLSFSGVLFAFSVIRHRQPAVQTLEGQS